MKTCSTCGEEKPIDQYGIIRKNTTDRRGQCRDCHLSRQRDKEKRQRAERNLKIISEREAGKSLVELSAKYGITAAGIQKICKKGNVKSSVADLKEKLQEFAAYDTPIRNPEMMYPEPKEKKVSVNSEVITYTLTPEELEKYRAIKPFAKVQADLRTTAPQRRGVNRSNTKTYKRGGETW